MSKLIIGQDGILSTPALSCMIRKYKTTGGIILTASHNPGGINGDFGIKYNMGNGGPAPSDFTDRIYKLSQEIKSFKLCKGFWQRKYKSWQIYFPEIDTPLLINVFLDLECDISKVGVSTYSIDGMPGDFTVEIHDSFDDYTEMMKSIFDFGAIREHLQTTKIVLNSMHGVTGETSNLKA